MNDQNKEDTTQGWNTYWQGAGGGEAFTSGGVSHPGFPAFWATALSEFLAAHADNNVAKDTTGVARILDIATGSGAVIQAFSMLPGAKLENVSCIDVSPAAIDGVKSRFPDVSGVVADASAIPLEAGQFDLITSQFGIEYAGLNAIDEAVRLLAPGGSLLFLLHIQSGALYRECRAAVDALGRAQQSGFIELTRNFFESGFAAVRGADRAPYEAAARAMNPAIQKLEAILAEHGEHVAGDAIVTLLSTVQTIHSRIQHYNPDEALGWLTALEEELPKHEERMASMRNAALDEDALKGVCERLTEQGLTIDRAQASHVEGDELPIAWVLQATRQK